MLNVMTAYFYALTGAFGALVGWLVAGLALDLISPLQPSMLVRTLVKGLFLSAGIAAAVCGRERATLTDLKTGIRDALFGGPAGAVAGAGSAVLGLLMFNQFGQNILGRAIGYLVLGSVIGGAEGLVWRRQGGLHRAKTGLVGGAIGGLFAAFVYQLLSRYTSSTLGDASAAILLGGSLGGCISTACTFTSQAVLQVMAAPKNKLLGRRLNLGKIGSRDVIGSDANVSVPIITDESSLAPQHAEIVRRGREYYIRPLAGDSFRPGQVIVNGHRVKDEVQLHTSDRIEVGHTVFQFFYLKEPAVRAADGSLQTA